MILLTGPNGFIGKALCSALLGQGFDVRAVVRDRESAQSVPAGAKSIVVGDIASVTDWAPLLDGVDVVVHLAARVHQMNGGDDSLYQKINVDVTRELALACHKAGVQRFIFVSSVKVMGELTKPGEFWNEHTPCVPQDAYGQSKLAAEKILIDISRTTGLEIVILRFPLVYGAAVKANMAKLIQVVNSKIPLPFESIKNKRSLLYVGNAVDAIQICLKHPSACGETFLVSDGEDISTPELICQLASIQMHSACLFSFPPRLLRFIGKISGQSHVLERLLDSLVIDSSKIRRVLSWQPPYSLKDGLRGTFETLH